MRLVDELRHVMPGVDPQTGTALRALTPDEAQPVLAQMFDRMRLGDHRHWGKVWLPGHEVPAGTDPHVSRAQAYAEKWRTKDVAVIVRDGADGQPHLLYAVERLNEDTVEARHVLGGMSNTGSTIRRALWDCGIRRFVGETDSGTSLARRLEAKGNRKLWEDPASGRTLWELVVKERPVQPEMRPWFDVLHAGECSSVHAVQRLAESPLLTPEEREYARNVLLPEEARHVWLAARLIETTGAVEAKSLPDAAPDEETDTLALLKRVRAENLLVRGYAKVRPLLSAEQRVLMDEIVSDEERHVAWGRAVSKRLGVDAAESMLGDAPRIREAAACMSRLLTPRNPDDVEDRRA